MKLLVDRTGEQFLEIIEESGDSLLVQFISNEGIRKGKPFKDTLSGLFLTGWKPRTTSTAIGLERFKQGKLQDPKVSFAPETKCSTTLVDAANTPNVLADRCLTHSPIRPRP